MNIVTEFPSSTVQESKIVDYIKMINTFLLGTSPDAKFLPENWPMDKKDFIVVLIALFQKYPNAMYLRINDIPRRGILEGDYFYLNFFIDAFVYSPEILDVEVENIISKFKLLRKKITNYIAFKRNTESAENYLLMDYCK